MTQESVRATHRGAPPRPQAPPRRRRRVLRALSVVLIAAGALLVADAVLTVTWQEPITAYFTNRTQHRLSDDLARLRARPTTAAEAGALARLDDERRRLAFLADSLQHRLPDGAAAGRIRIPRIGASFVVVNGTSSADLRKGPGFYDGQPFPGAGGTTAIAGHRTTYLAPFRHIDELRRGDRITVTMPYATFTYAVEGHRIVSPSDLSVLRDVGRERLVLSACHPLFSAAQRIIVFAKPVHVRAETPLLNSGEMQHGLVRRPATGIKAGPPSGR